MVNNIRVVDLLGLINLRIGRSERRRSFENWPNKLKRLERGESNDCDGYIPIESSYATLRKKYFIHILNLVVDGVLSDFKE